MRPAIPLIDASVVLLGECVHRLHLDAVDTSLILSQDKLLVGSFTENAPSLAFLILDQKKLLMGLCSESIPSLELGTVDWFAVAFETWLVVPVATVI